MYISICRGALIRSLYTVCAMICCSLEHTQQDVEAKEQLLKTIELQREEQAKKVDEQQLKQNKIEKTQAWVKKAMRAEDSNMAADLKRLMQVRYSCCVPVLECARIHSLGPGPPHPMHAHKYSNMSGLSFKPAPFTQHSFECLMRN